MMFMKCIVAIMMMITMLFPVTVQAQEPANLTIRFRTADGSKTAASSITLDANGNGILPELKTEDAGYIFRGWALQADSAEPAPGTQSAKSSDQQTAGSKEQTDANRKAAEKNRLSSWSSDSKTETRQKQAEPDKTPKLSEQTISGLILKGSIKNFMVSSLNQTINIKSVMPSSGTLTLYARWTEVKEPVTTTQEASDEEKSSESIKLYQEEKTTPEGQKTPAESVPEAAPSVQAETEPQNNALPEDLDLPETDTEGSETDEPYTIHFKVDAGTVEDLSFYEGSVKNIPEPEPTEDGFLGWKIVNPQAKTDIQGGFNPEEDILLSTGQLDVHTVDYADLSDPYFPVGVTTLSPFYDENRELTLEAVYQSDLPAEADYSTELYAVNASPTAYATFNKSTGALDFYWGTPPESTSNLDVMPFDLYVKSAADADWPWTKKYATQIKTATFHNQYTPYITQEWFSGCTNLKTINRLDKLNWANCKGVSWMFANCSSLTSLDVSTFQPSSVSNFGGMFLGCTNLTYLDVSKWDTSSGTLFNGMFMGCTKLKDLDVSNFKTGKASSIALMFRNCSSLENLDVSKWDVSNSTNDEGVFAGCTNLKALDVSSWDVSKNKTLFMTFMSCNNLILTGYENWDTSNVTSMNRTFTGVKNDVLKLNKWNTSKNTSLEWTFGGAQATSIEISNWDTSNVTTMLSMCTETPNLKDFNCATWNTGNVTTMENAFRWTYVLESLPVGNWDTHSNKSLYQTFQAALKLTDLDVSKWDTSNVTTLYCTFNQAASLPKIDAAEWDTSKVTNMRWTFGNMDAITALDVTDWKTDSVTEMDHMFYQMPSLELLKMGGQEAWNTSNVTNEYNMFMADPKLSTVILSPNFSFIGGATQSNRYGILMEAPQPAFGIDGAPEQWYGNWYCTDAADGGKYAGSPAELQASYNGPTMAGTWTWAKGGRFDVKANLEGNAKVVPETLTANLTAPENFKNVQSGEAILPAELTLNKSPDQNVYTGSAYGYNTSTVYAPEISGVPDKYELMSKTGSVDEGSAYTMNSDTGNAEYTYQYYLPAELPRTGGAGMILAGSAGLTAILASAYEIAKRRNR